MNRRKRAIKLGVPDWVCDDTDLPETGASSRPSSAVASVDDESQTSDIPREKMPFKKPTYEYLPGNKHAQKLDWKLPISNQDGLESQLARFSVDAIAMAMPLISFSGSIVYSYNAGDCSLICADIMDRYLDTGRQELHVGFDLEWPVTYTRGAGGGKVALVQLSVDESKCYLFHLSAMSTLPMALKTLLEHDSLKKIGVNIESDMWKLTRDFDFDGRHVIRTSMIDLGKLANTLLKSTGVWSLDGLCRNILRMRMNKDESVRCGNWDDFPLNDEQKMYAATDAYAALKIHNVLMTKKK